MSRSRPNLAFTLVELAVVIVLLGLAAGLATVRLDGLTDTGVLRSTAGQIGALLRLVATDARFTGSPRMLRLEFDKSSIVVARPEWRHGEASWNLDQIYRLPNGARVERILIPGVEYDPERLPAVRINAEGRHRSHAVLLSSHERWAVAWFPQGGPPRWEMLDRIPLARTYEDLEHELTKLR